MRFIAAATFSKNIALKLYVVKLHELETICPFQVIALDEEMGWQSCSPFVLFVWAGFFIAAYPTCEGAPRCGVDRFLNITNSSTSQSGSIRLFNSDFF